MISLASSKGLTPGKGHTAECMRQPAERECASPLPAPQEKDPSRCLGTATGETGDEVASSAKRRGRVPTPLLDLIEHNRNKRCGCWSLQGKEEGKTRYIKLGCKAWSCPQCGPKKAKRLRHAIIKRATEKNLRRFLTLTLDPSTCRPEDSVPYIRKCWNKFRTSLKRQGGGKSIAYIAVLELQKNGYAHLHVLVDRYLPQGWISKAWQGVGGGRIVHIKQVDIQRVGAYLSKYLTKELFLVQGKARRCTTSRDIMLFEKLSQGQWLLVKLPVEVICHLLGRRVDEMQMDAQGRVQSFSSALALW